jgi:hypothetical protein
MVDEQDEASRSFGSSPRNSGWCSLGLSDHQVNKKHGLLVISTAYMYANYFLPCLPYEVIQPLRSVKSSPVSYLGILSV